VIDIVLLSVPVAVVAGFAGVTTAGLKSMFRSYEITPSPVTSPTVIGTAIAPGVATTAGNDTATFTKETVLPDASTPRIPTVAPFASLSETTGALTSFDPLRSTNANRDEPAPKADAINTTPIRRATKAKMLGLRNLPERAEATLLMMDDDIRFSLKV